MAILKIKDSQGNFIEVPAIKGDSYTITDEDYNEIAEVTKGKLQPSIDDLQNNKENTSNKVETIDTSNKSSKTLYPSNKAITDYVDDAIPTKTSQLVNDSDFIVSSSLTPIIEKNAQQDIAISSKANSSQVDELESKQDETARSLDMLWKLNQGQTYDIEEKEESGMNEAPSGAKYMTLEEVYGNTTQKTTNGYQLIHVKQRNVGEVNGISYATENGFEWQINGTATADAYLSRGVGNASTLVENGFAIESGTYTFSWEAPAIEGVIGQILTTDGTSAITSSVIGALGFSTSNRTVTIDKTLYCYPRIVVYKDVAVNNVNIKLMLEKGSVAHPYESYTGGIPSPSPSYPQDIISVEELNVKVVGKNLYKTITPPKPLNKIGDYADVCDVEKGVWEWNVGKQQLSYLSSWAKAGNNVDRYYCQYSQLGISVKDIDAVLCSHFNKGISGETIGVFITNATNIGFAFAPKGTTSSGDFVRFNNESGAYILYADGAPATKPINETDLTFLRSLELLSTDNHIIITDQLGRDVSYLLEYIIKLSEVR